MLQVLIVDDSPMFRQVVRELLLSHFSLFQVAEAGDGEEALAGLARLEPELIIMDVRLPGESGIALTRKIKTAHPNSAIIILTSFNLPEYREAALLNGADYFLPKNIPSIELIKAVERVIQVHR
jgi:DNA-binding NarL/FixJ family response regulator